MMSIQVFVSANNLIKEIPVVFPDAPMIGDEIDVLSFYPFHSDQRKDLLTIFNEQGLFAQGKVIQRFWSCKDSQGDPLLHITVELESKP